MFVLPFKRIDHRRGCSIGHKRRPPNFRWPKFWEIPASLSARGAAHNFNNRIAIGVLDPRQNMPLISTSGGKRLRANMHTAGRSCNSLRLRCRTVVCAAINATIDAGNASRCQWMTKASVGSDSTTLASLVAG